MRWNSRITNDWQAFLCAKNNGVESVSHTLHLHWVRHTGHNQCGSCLLAEGARVVLFDLLGCGFAPAAHNSVEVDDAAVVSSRAKSELVLACDGLHIEICIHVVHIIKILEHNVAAFQAKVSVCTAAASVPHSRDSGGNVEAHANLTVPPVQERRRPVPISRSRTAHKSRTQIEASETVDDVPHSRAPEFTSVGALTMLERYPVQLREFHQYGQNMIFLCILCWWKYNSQVATHDAIQGTRNKSSL